MKEPNLRPLIEWMETSETVPEWESMLRFSEETKELWVQKDLLTMVDGVLHRKWITGIGSVRWKQLIVPRNLRKEIIQLMHAGAAGHLLIRKTLEQLRRRAFWKGWHGDVRRYCRACRSCSRYHRGLPQRQARLQDMLLPGSEQELTCSHVLAGEIIISSPTSITSLNSQKFTQFQTKRRRLCQILTKEICPRHGVPLQVVTNHGKEFENRLLRGLCDCYEIEGSDLPYRQSTNGAIERLHLTINAMLGRIIDESQRY